MKMRKLKNKFLLIVLSTLMVLMVWGVFSLSAQTQPPDSQTTGGLDRLQRDIEKDKMLREKIQEKVEAPIEKEAEEVVEPLPEEETILISDIIVEGVTLVSQEDIEEVVSQFEGKNLSLKDMQKVADLVTDLYRTRGYATSRAYLPPQTIKDGVLIIRVVEGRVGQIDIEGNRWFKSSILEKKILVKSQEPFDYAALQKSLVFINEHPDRTARAVLVPGKEPGTTDIVIDVEDRFPFHIGFEYNNFGSHYIERDTMALVLEHNNFLGFDDKVYFKFQTSERSHYTLKNLRYLFPVSNDCEAGLYFIRNKVQLAHEFRDVDARGDSEVYGVFLNKGLVLLPNVDARLNLGFDYKKIKNFLLGFETSRDDIRVLKTGIDLDFMDRWGRNLVLIELDTGIPRMWGALTAKDIHSSRVGSGGRFLKWLLNVYRLQPLPLDSSFLAKINAQFSNYNLVASEQFQIGGATSVRGFPPAEFSGDSGLYTAAEWSFPLYLVPRKMKIPFTQEKLYDALRLVLFYDWGTTKFHSVLPGQKRNRTLRSCGFGIRFHIRDNMSFRMEFGYPLGNRTPSDNDHLHKWVEFTVKF